MNVNKVCISLILVVLISTPAFSTAMSAEQAEGYAIQEATETYLSGLAEIKISTQQEAIELANKIKKGVPIQKSTLLTGNSVVSSFSKEFVNCPHIIDFIYIAGNNIELIESKRSGVGTTDQIKCFDNLGDALKRKGFVIKKKISCNPEKCKLPSQWEKRVVRSIPKGGLTILEVGSFTIYVEILSRFIESTVDTEINRKRNLCYNRQELTSSAGLPLLWQVPEKECMCINNNELRFKCCTTVISDIFYSQFNWNKFVNQFPLCRNEADYAFKKCVEDMRNRYFSNIKDAENFCSNLKQSTGSSSNKCTSNFEKKCYNMDVYWYDSCGVREEIAEKCSMFQACLGQSCQKVTSYERHYTKKCKGNDVYWIDSNNQFTDHIKSCNSCINGECMINTNTVIEEEKLKNFKEEKYERRCVLAFCWRKKVV